MMVYCARIYIGGAKLDDVKRHLPNARKIGKRVYVGYDNANGAIFSQADRVASLVGGYVESEAD